MKYPTASLFTISGAANSAVAMETLATTSGSSFAANPKSISFRLEDFEDSKRMFSGLRSKWTMHWSCIDFNAWQICLGQGPDTAD